MNDTRISNSKIAILAQSLPCATRSTPNGGMEVLLTHIIKTLSQNNSVTVITQTNHKSSKEIFESPNCQIKRVGPPIMYQKNNWKKFVEVLAVSLKRMRLLAQAQADYIIAADHTTYIETQILSFIKRKKIIIIWADLLGWSWPRYFGAIGVMGLIAESITRINHYALHWTISEYTRNRLKTFLPKNAITQVLALQNVTPRPAYLQQPKEKKILIVGRFVNYKRHHTGILIFSKLVKKFPGLQLVMVGDGPEKEKCRKLVAQLKLQDSVLFRSALQQAELTYLFETSQMVLHLSVVEGYCLVIQEALYNNCYVLAADLPVYKELYSSSPKFSGIPRDKNEFTNFISSAEKILASNNEH